VDRLPDLLRYRTAVQRRLDALPGATDRDRERLTRVEQVEREHATWFAGLHPERRDDAEVRSVRWMLEELRVSLFAQQLGTPSPVSEKRIYRAMDALDE
jgi:ATP-dependent helicase HrpA